MKRFSLNKKRASKVLALTLVAAMAVPTLSFAQKSAVLPLADDAETVTVPEAIATVNLDELVVPDVNVKQLKFTKATKVGIWNNVSSDGNLIATATYASLDAVPEMVAGATDAGADKYDPAKYVWEETELTPEIVQVTDDAVSGKALSLKKGVVVDKNFPSAAINKLEATYGKDANNKDIKVTLAQYKQGLQREYDRIQSAGVYSSGVKVENPFVAIRNKLYDPSRYTLENIANTATEVTRVTKSAVSLAQNENTRVSSPEAKTGITVSFWAKLPEEAQKESANFLEFSNTKTLLPQTDDMAKVWATNWINSMKDTSQEEMDKEGSLFYGGEIVTGKAIDVGTKEVKGQSDQRGFKPRNGEEFSATGNAVIAYVINNGPLAFLNEENAKMYSEYTYVTGNGKTTGSAVRKTNNDAKGNALSVKVLVVATTCTMDEWSKGVKSSGAGGRNGCLVESGLKNADGQDLYYVLMESTDIFVDRENAEVTSKMLGNQSYLKDLGYVYGEGPDKLGKKTRCGSGSTGRLYIGTDAVEYWRDANVTEKTPTGSNKTNPDDGNYQKVNTAFQSANQGSIAYEDLAVDTEWHYYTVTITDEWFQMYVDGEAVDGKVTVGNLFNMGSGMFSPNGDGYYAANAAGTDNNDSYKLYNANTKTGGTGFILAGYNYGLIFGVPVMDFVSDPNTEVYIGGKTRETLDGTLIAGVSFYDVKMTKEQVEEAYKQVAGGNEEEEGTDVLLGDVNNDKVIDSKDALEILKEDVGVEHTGTFIVEVANVTKDTNDDGEAIVDSKDALAILKHDVDVEKIPEEYIKVVLEEAPAE